MGWLGFLFIGGGVLSVWAGFTGTNLIGELRSVLTGEPVVGAPATPGASGASGLQAPTAGAGQGGGGGSGGGW